MAAEQDFRESCRLPWKIFWIALAVRLAYVAFAHTWRIRAVEDHAHFGWEMGRVARALATGRGFADPFLTPTGPTAWVSPLYPIVLAGIFKVFGIYSAGSAVVAIGLNCLFSALTSLTTFVIGRRCFSENVGLWAAWIWALYPPSMQFATRSIWETTLSTLLVSCAIVVALRLRGLGDISARGRRDGAALGLWIQFGILAGLLGLSNPSSLLFIAAAGVWALLPLRRAPTAGPVLAVLIAAASIAPWMIRNAHVFHRFIPMRTNAGAEFYLGNGPGATGLVMEYDHPFFDQNALTDYRKLGEVAYAQRQGALAWEGVRQLPGHFVGLVARRVYFFWCGVPHEAEWRWDRALGDWFRLALFCFTSVAGLLGLGLAVVRRVPATGLVVSAFALLPVVYYFVFVHARFRHPLEPLIAVLGVWLFQSATRQGSGQAKIDRVGA